MTTENEHDGRIKDLENRIECLTAEYQELQEEYAKTEKFAGEEVEKIMALKKQIKTLKKQISNLENGRDIDEDCDITFWDTSKKYFIIGGVILLGGVGFWLFNRDEEIIEVFEEPDTI